MFISSDLQLIPAFLRDRYWPTDSILILNKVIYLRYTGDIFRACAVTMKKTKSKTSVSSVT